MTNLTERARTRVLALTRRAVVFGLTAAALFLLPAAAQAATYTVTKTADTADGVCDADCSLREAIIAANGNLGHDTINVPPGTYTLTLTGSEGPETESPSINDLDILEGVTLNGTGSDPTATIIQAAAAPKTAPGRVIMVYMDNAGGKDVSTTIQNVTIRHGYMSGATGLFHGGGVDFYAAAGPGNLRILNSVITLNGAGAHGGGIAGGSNGQAGVYLWVDHTAITNNIAGDQPTLPNNIGGSGGAIQLGGNVALKIDDSLLQGNTSRAGNTYATGQGGAIFLFDDTTSGIASYINNTVIDGNTAIGMTKAGAGGAFIGRPIRITNTTISNNTADDYGGGLVLSEINGYTATLGNVTVSGNTTKTYGGGIYLSHGGTTAPTFNFVNLTVTNNRADSDGIASGEVGGDIGGGIRRQTSVDTGNFNIYNTIVAGNFKGTGSTADDIQFIGVNMTGTNNLTGTGGSGGLNAGTNQTGVATPRLGALANNGHAARAAWLGTLQTHALQGDSGALDGGDGTKLTFAGLNLTTDARGAGWARVLDAADQDTTDRVDIGALEMHPSVADRGAVTMLQDTTTTATIDLGDVDLGIDTFTAVSNNPAVLPNPVVTGSGSTRTLTLAPNSGAWGTVTITLTTTDTYNGVSQTMTDTLTVTIVQRPNLTVTKSHTNGWKQGETGKTYTITVSNLAGAGATLASGNPFGIDPTVTLVDTLPAGLTATAINGTGWTCTLGTLTCTRQDVLNAGNSYPAITLTVNVSDNALPSVTNTAVVSGNADNTPGNNTATDPTTIIQTPELTVTKVHTDPWKQGEFGKTYTITVSNDLPASGLNTGPTSGTVTVVDTLPAGLTATAVSGTGWSCVLGTLTCTRSDALAAGASYPAITVTVDVARDAATPRVNSVTVSGGGELASRNGNNSATDSTPIVQMPDLTIAKAPVGTFRQGQDAAYTVTVTNSGFASTDGSTVTVTDTLPAGLTFVSGTGLGWSCSAVGQTVTCTNSGTAGAAGAFPAITLNVHVADDAATSVTNNASVTGGGQIWTANDTVATPTTIVLAPDLKITKSHSGNFTQGESNKTYTLTVSNKAGVGPTFGAVTVSDTIPSGLTLVSMSGTGWDCSAGISCTRSDALAAGASYPAITVTVNVDATAPSSVTNTATVAGGAETGSTLTDNTASDPTTIIQLPDLTVSVTEATTFTQNQSGAQYTLTVSNIGTGPTAGTVTVTDTLPTGLSFVSGSSSSGFSCTASGQTVTCTRTTAIASGEVDTITLSVDVAHDAGASLVNNVSVSGGGELAGQAGNNTGTTTTSITQLPDLTVAIAEVGTFRQGQDAAYTITVTNSGSVGTGGTVTVTDTLPAGLTYVSGTGLGWSCSAVGQTVTCTNEGSAAGGGDFPAITLNVHVADNAATSVTNNASVTGGGQSYTANDSASVTTTIVQAPDLAITKSHTGNFTQGESNKTYTLTVSNKAGVGPTSGEVTVSDTIPAGLTLVSMSGTGWDCTASTSCTRNDALAAGASYPAITVTVNVDATAPSSVTNTATVAGGAETGSTLTDNTASDPTTIIQLPDLTVSVTEATTFTQNQSGAQYTLTVSNIGTGPTSGTVTVTDTLPAGLSFVSGSSSSGFSCTASGQTVTCTRTTAIASGEVDTITLSIDVAHDAGASLVNNVSVSGGGELAGQAGNNTGTTTTSITQLPDLTVAIAEVGTFRQGQDAAYTITVTNSGSVGTGGTVTVTDTLPAGLTSVSGTGLGWSCSAVGQTVTCTNEGSAAGGGDFPAITLNVHVADNAATSVTNNASVTGGGQSYTANDSASVITTVAKAPQLTLSKSHTGNFTQGQTGATYTLTVHNVAGADPTFADVTVTDSLPAGLSYSGFSGTGWTCTDSLGTITCTYTPVINAGADSATLTITVDVAATAAPTIVNTATVSGGGEVASATGDNSASDSATVNQLPDLQITVAPTGTFRQGDTGSYSLVVANNGTGLTSGTVSVAVDTLPAGLTATGLSGTNWSCTLGTLTCDRTDALSAGASYEVITLTVSISPDAAASLTTQVTVAGGNDVNGANNTGAHTTTIVPMPDLTVVQGVVGSLGQGRPGQLTFQVHNDGDAATTADVTLTDTLPAGISYTGVSGLGWSCSASGQDVTCSNAGTAGAGSDFPLLTLNVTVDPTALSATNLVTVSGGGEVYTANSSDSDTLSIDLAPNLAVSVSADTPWAQGDSGKSYTITVSNHPTAGPTSGDVIVTDTLDASLAYVSGTGTNWSCVVVDQTVTCTYTGPAVNGGNDLPDLTLMVDVAEDAPPSVANSATVSGGSELPAAVGPENTATTNTPVTQIPNLVVSITNGAFAQGQTGATYTITLTNGGFGQTSGTTTLTATIPTGLTLVGITPADAVQWTCPDNTCSRTSPIPSGETTTFLVTVDVARDAAANLTTSVAVPALNDSNSSNNSASAATTVTQMPDLTLTLTPSGTFKQGQIGTYYLLVANNGHATATDSITVTTTLPAEMNDPTFTADPPWDCSVSGKTVTCTNDEDLSILSTYALYQIHGTVAEDAPASITLSASLTGGGQIDASETDSKTVTVDPAADLSVSMSHTGDFTQGQAGATYTIQVANNAAAGTSTGMVTVTVTPPPAGFGNYTLAGLGWNCVGLTCDRSDVLGTGSSYPALTLTLDVDATASPSLTPQVSVDGGGELTPTKADNVDSDPTHIIQLPNLAVTISHADDFAQGQTGAQYEITLTNNGSGQTEGPISLTVTLGSGLTATDWQAEFAFNCSGLTCNAAGPLLPGETASFVLTVDVDKDTAASVNTTVVASVLNDQIPGDNSATDATTVEPKPDLALTLTPGASFEEGLTASFDVALHNQGHAATLPGVTVTDTLPLGLTPVGNGGSGTGWTCNAVGQTISCTSADSIDVGNDYPTLTLEVLVGDDVPATLENTATLSGGGQLNPSNDADTKTVTIIQAPELTLEITHSGSFEQGQTGQFILTVNNNSTGPTRTAPVTVTATLHPKLSVTAASGTGWDCTFSGQSVSCEQAVAAGDPYPSITIDVDVADDAPASVSIAANVAGGGELLPNASDNNASDAAWTMQHADLALSMTHTGNFVQDENADYTLTVTNQGGGATIGTMTVTDTLPVGLSFVSGGGDDWTCTEAGGEVTCERTTPLAPGDSTSFTLTVLVAVDAPELLTNEATVALPPGEELIVGGENTASDPTTVGIIPDLVVDLTGPTSLRQGAASQSYTISVRNVGQMETDGTDVTLTLDVTSGLTVRSITPDGAWTCDVETMSCTTAAVVPGQTDFPSITLLVDVEPHATPTTATVSASATGGGEHQTPSLDSLNVAIVKVADLQVTKSHTGNFQQGQVGATYTLTVSNNGDGPTDADFTVNDTLPAGIVPTATSLPSDCTITGRTVDCTFTAPLASGASFTFTVTANVATDAAESVTNTATIAGGGEYDTTNNDASDLTTIEPMPNLTVSKRHSGNFSRGRKKAPYEITVTNVGYAPTAGLVTVTDLLPVEMQGVALSGTGWTCDLATLTCTRTDALAPGASYPVITLAVDVSNSAPISLVTNQVTVSGGGELDTSNNTATDPTNIVPKPRPVDPSYVTITPPLAETNLTSIVLNGTANPNITITVNGQPVAVQANGRWQVRVDLAEGVNTITAVNGPAVDSVTVTRDTTPPALKLTASASETTEDEVTLTAETEPGAKVYIDGKEGLTQTAKLNLGENRFRAVATDRLGNQSTATVLVVRTSPPPTACYTDLVGHWAKESVCKMVEVGVAAGYPDSTYMPDQAITRLEFSVMVVKALGIAEIPGRPTFTDSFMIPQGDWGAVNAAVKAGLLSGYPDGSFKPGSSISRAEIAILMMRSLKQAGLSGAPGTVIFGDWATVPDWAQEAVRIAVRAGLISGYPDGTFSPGRTATRAEATVMTERLWNLLHK